MADGKQGGSSGGLASMAEYKKAQARVRDLVEKRRALERKLAQLEDSIGQKETTYLESTPAGNIVTGFDNYMKGATGGAAQRRKTGSMEQNRVFSRSSISHRPTNWDSSTPGSTPASHAPTPFATSLRDHGSQSTPNTGAGHKSANRTKKKDNEDSEGDAQPTKKRTSFGPSRK